MNDLIEQMRGLNKELKKQYGSKGICTIAVTPSTKDPSSFVLVLPGLRQNLSPNQAKTRFVRSKYVNIIT